MNAPVLDTHVWIWWIMGSPDLSKAERDALDSLSANDRPVLCDISIWEFATLVDLGRLEIDMPVEEWLRVTTAPSCVRLQAVTPRIAGEMNLLPSSFHRDDPADRLIVATARALGLPLATHDRKIRKSRLAPLWKA